MASASSAPHEQSRAQVRRGPGLDIWGPSLEPALSLAGRGPPCLVACGYRGRRRVPRLALNYGYGAGHGWTRMSWLLEVPISTWREQTNAEILWFSKTAHSRTHGKPRDMSADFPVAKGPVSVSIRDPAAWAAWGGDGGSCPSGCHRPSAAVQTHTHTHPWTGWRHLGSERPEE